MQIKVDWFSFTVKREVQNDDDELIVLRQVLATLRDYYPASDKALGLDETWSWKAGRKPYRASFRSADDGIGIFIHPALNHAMVEFTGRGCDHLAEWRDPVGFMDAFKERCNRIDVACDMLTDTDPVDFAYTREQGRFQSDGHIKEESGTTVYIGSQKSNRFARVYRYNPPHDRAHLLRCEYVLRAEDAKATAASIIENGKESVAAALGRAFGWTHKDWLVEAPTEIELRAYRPDRKIGATIFWLNDTVAPLLRRLHQSGDINATEWLHNLVLRDNVDGIDGF